MNLTKALITNNFSVVKLTATPSRNPTTRSTYEQKLKLFDVTQIITEQETVEDYSYTHTQGKRDTVQVVIIENSVSMTATIDFKDVEQYENFICPEWITLA